MLYTLTMHWHTHLAMGDRNTIVVTICKIVLIALFLSLFICFRYLSVQNAFKIHLETVWNVTSSLASFAKARTKGMGQEENAIHVQMKTSSNQNNVTDIKITFDQFDSIITVSEEIC